MCRMKFLTDGATRCESDLPNGETLVLIFHTAKSEGLISRGDQKLGTWDRTPVTIDHRNLTKHRALFCLAELGGYVSVGWTHDSPQDHRADKAFSLRTVGVVESFLTAAYNDVNFKLRAQVLENPLTGVHARYTPQAQVQRLVDSYRAPVPNHAAGQMTPERAYLQGEMDLLALKKSL